MTGPPSLASKEPVDPSGPDSVPPAKPTAPRFPRAGIALLAALLAVLWIWRATTESLVRDEIPYSKFYSLADAGQVARVAFDGQRIAGDFKVPVDVGGKKLKSFRTTAPRQDDSLIPLLRTKQVEVTVAPEEQPFALNLLWLALPWVLLLGAWFWLSRRAQKTMSLGGPLGAFLKGKTHKFERTERTRVTFDDVAGLGNAKRDLQEVVGFLREPERFRRLGGKVPRGVLLVGPPGTGKTLLARAVAGESGVPFFSITGSEFIELFVGVGAARVRDLFEEAKKAAPSIVFIDELDAVGRSRGAGLGGGHDEREQTLNQLLSEMDGFSRNDLTVVIAATNRPDVLDPALLRPGRFDRRVVVDRPELDARRSILRVHARNKPLASDVDLDEVARSTAGFSGADLENLVNEAALSATRRGADALYADDFRAAYDKVVLGDPRDAKLDEKEKRRVAVHESGHALVAYFAESAEPPQRVSIIPRGMALGATHQLPGSDRHIMTKTELEARLWVLLGGYAAERLVFQEVSTGAENDLREATRLATKMVANYGMSEALGAVYYEHQEEHPFLGQRIATDSGASDATIAAVEVESRSVLRRALDSATAIIERRKADLERLSSELVEKETIDKERLEELLGARVAARPTVELRGASPRRLGRTDRSHT